MEKLDLKKQYEAIYKIPKGKIATVKVPRMKYLMIEGAGDPNNNTAFQQGMQALFSLSYTLKFMVKKERSIDYGVLPPEGLWWAEDMSAFMDDDRTKWKWTLMIPQPDLISAAMVKQAKEELARKKKDLPALAAVSLRSMNEGLCAQVMHEGPYATEGPNIQRLHAYINEQNCQLYGMHHEIYLSDFRRTAPEKLRTIIRQPMRKK